MQDALIGRRFAGYRIDEQVGRGGMGVVYRAVDEALERTVALKLLAPELADDDAFRRRFISESKLAASLDHPHVIPIYAAGEHEGTLFLAMRFVDGEDLRGLLRRVGRLDPRDTVRLVGQVASALDAAHRKDLVHRDVKPANVLLDGDGHAYLSDFGLTKRVSAESAATRTGQLLGTLDYVAPEQIRAEPIGPYTDVYALGCMAFHLLTGRVPFPLETEEAKLWAHLSEPPPHPSALAARCPPGLDAVVANGMAKRPADRYASAGALAKAAAAALDRPATSVRGAPARRTSPPARRTSPPARRPSPPARRPAAPAAVDPRAPSRREITAALADPFNLALVAGLLAAGVLLDRVVLMAVFALVVYAVGTALHLRERGDGA